MLKFRGSAALALMAVAMPFATPMQAARAATLGPYAARCDSGGMSVIARIDGLKARGGVLRVQLYANNAATFLEKKQYLQRVEVAVPRSGAVDICVPVPRPGAYAISVRHDANSNGKSDRKDGGGFSGNPKVSLLDMVFKRKPALAKSLFTVSSGPKVVPVTVNYF
ncbi:DUF2141 domain-containing protein [Sphingobium boeckii]|uniref:Uncharacterized protein (DUF2141 family) n=1 Tax=Sphingobium boeckii TaxID=1082345 RepID=A0A7W9AGX5_9SPHN|nr:DUF2141 domain-containing protein [Sphingobium boeckii]MBB5685410.1 uncharacterized protein (DUF2141 family) [Sphingobium boeckii]